MIVRDEVVSLLSAVGPMNYLDLLAEIGCSKAYMTECLRRLHADKVIFVKSWERTGLQLARVWALRTNRQVDAPRPPALGNKVWQQNYRDRHAAKLKHKRSVRAVNNPFSGLLCL